MTTSTGLVGTTGVCFSDKLRNLRLAVDFLEPVS